MTFRKISSKGTTGFLTQYTYLSLSFNRNYWDFILYIIYECVLINLIKQEDKWFVY